MIVKLLTEHHLVFLSLKDGCRGSSESTHVKMPHCWKSHATAHFIFVIAYMIQHVIWIVSVSVQRSAFFTDDNNKTTDFVI